MKKLAVASVATGAVAVLSNHNEASTQHTVKSGESLWSIASKYNTSVDSIKKSNNLSNNMIFPGQVISIGRSNNSNNASSNATTSSSTYTVKAAILYMQLLVKWCNCQCINGSQ